MIKVTLPDGSKMEVEKDTLIVSLAKEISPSLAKKAIVAKLDGVLVDLKTPIEKDSKVEIITPENKEEAFAMRKQYSALAFNFGPNTDNYYVIDEKMFKILQDLL